MEDNKITSINMELDDYSDEYLDDDLAYEDLDAEEAMRLSEEMLQESIKIRESIVYPEIEDTSVVNLIELKSPEDGKESPLKRLIKELVNSGNYERKDFVEYMNGDNEQARKMINTYPKKKDFKMEEFIMWLNFLNYDIKIVKDPDQYDLGELRASDSDDRLVKFDNNENFIPIKQMLVELINESNLKLSNIKSYYKEKPSDAYNIIERFKKNNTMTTETFTLWLFLIGYTIKLVKREN